MGFLKNLFGRSGPDDQLEKDNIKAVVERLKNHDPKIRAKAASALGSINTDEVIDLLIDALKDSDLTVRVKAAESLGESGNPRSVLPLIDSIRTPSLKAFMAPVTIVQTEKATAEKMGRGEYVILIKTVSKAIERIGQEAILPLIEALKETSIRIRAISLIVLGRIGSDKAIPAINTVFENEREDFHIRTLASLSLDSLKGNSFLTSLDQLEAKESRFKKVSALVFIQDVIKGDFSKIEQLEFGLTTTHLERVLKRL